MGLILVDHEVGNKVIDIVSMNLRLVVPSPVAYVVEFFSSLDLIDSFNARMCGASYLFL